MFKSTIPPRLSQFVEGQLSSPLIRNAYALMLNTGATSLLGFLYWKLAALFYTPDVVGLNLALVSTLTFLTTLASLNLGSALNRFIPRMSIKRLWRVVPGFYGLTTFLGVIAALVFLNLQNALDPQNAFLQYGDVFAGGFIVAIIIWIIFNLQDNVLIGLRKSVWVPIENIIFSIGKIVLLVAFISLSPQFGIIISWTIPIALAIIPINYLIFKHLIPAHIPAKDKNITPITPRRMARYVSADYIGKLLGTAGSQLLPLIVISQISTEANAYFSIAWMITFTSDLLATAMTQSLLVEGANDEKRLAEYTWRIIKQMMMIIVPLVTVLILMSGFIMGFFGEDYAINGTEAFRILALAGLPVSLNVLTISIARVQQRVSIILLVSGLTSILSLSIGFYMAQNGSITGVAIGYLTAQIIVCAFISLPVQTRLLVPYLRNRI